MAKTAGLLAVTDQTLSRAEGRQPPDEILTHSPGADAARLACIACFILDRARDKFDSYELSVCNVFPLGDGRRRLKLCFESKTSLRSPRTYSQQFTMSPSLHD